MILMCSLFVNEKWQDLTNDKMAIPAWHSAV